jgi:hypothetical protein
LPLSAARNVPVANTASLPRLARIAARLLLCRQAERAIRDGETSWGSIVAQS